MVGRPRLLFYFIHICASVDVSKERVFCARLFTRDREGSRRCILSELPVDRAGRCSHLRAGTRVHDILLLQLLGLHAAHLLWMPSPLGLLFGR
jgi:hypothetical protein